MRFFSTIKEIAMLKDFAANLLLENIIAQSHSNPFNKLS